MHFFNRLHNYRLALCILMCMKAFGLHAQMSQSSDRSLYVGDRVPNEIFEMVHKSIDLQTGDTATLRMADHGSKLIILDFWASWCLPCLGSLKHLHEIKGQLDTSKVLILPVTYQQPDEVEGIVDRFKWTHKSIYADTAISALFPHPGLPHMVWIKDGKVVSVPLPTYASVHNINEVVEGRMPLMAQNSDIKTFEYHKPIWQQRDARLETFYKASHLNIGGYAKDYARQDLEKTETTDSVFIHMINTPLDIFYYNAYARVISPYFYIFEDAIVLDMDAEKQKMFEKNRPPRSSDGNIIQDSIALQWARDNAYTLEYRVPKTYADTLWGNMIREGISHFSKQRFGIEPRIMLSQPKKYPILQVVDESAYQRLRQQKGLPKRKGDQYLQYAAGKRIKLTKIASVLMEKVKDKELDYSMVTDRTGHDTEEQLFFELSMELFKAKTLTFEQVNDYLKKYGLAVIIEQKKLPYLMLSAINNK